MSLISMDSTLKSDLTVGPPIDFVVYKKDQFKIASQKCLNLNDEEFLKMTNEWSEGILKVFKSSTSLNKQNFKQKNYA